MKHRGSVLVCDDDPALLALTRDLLEAEGHAVEACRSAREALSVLAERSFDLLLADLVMPAMGGLELLREARRVAPDMEVIIVTGHGDIDSAVQAIREGAYDYITKPFHLEKFAIDIQKALERKRLAEDLERLKRSADVRDRLGGLIGRSQAMASLFHEIEQVAPTGSTVMILGESGTGKEVTARTIHELSTRAGRPFVAFSCAALPPNLLESELFGHTRGAFTGADEAREGLFEAADGGTIFLDEIGAATPESQLRLLRVIQEREVRRVGSNRPRRVDVRIIAATNADLERSMDDGSFRGDLYYRLNGVALRLPPLRERAEDVPLLARHFLEALAAASGRPVKTLSPKTLEMLLAYEWPGNVRELEHVIEHAVVFSKREILRPRDLPPTLRSAVAGRGPGAPGTLEDVEREHIRRVLRFTKGNKLRAAKILMIPRASLYRRIDKYGL